MLPNDTIKSAICDQLQDRGWTLYQEPAIAIKTYPTAVGPKEAQVYLSDYDSENLQLSGAYNSKMSNILSTSSVCIPKNSDVHKIHELINQFSDNVDSIVKSSYAARLYLFALEEEQQQDESPHF